MSQKAEPQQTKSQTQTPTETPVVVPSKVSEDVMKELMGEEPSKTTEEAKAPYTPEEGTDNLLHLLLVKGRRFNPNTGDEISKPFIQMFTYPEWQVFKKNYVGLGLAVQKVLHDPFDEAESYLAKAK